MLLGMCLRGLSLRVPTGTESMVFAAGVPTASPIVEALPPMRQG
jgi:hypothetical protein